MCVWFKQKRTFKTPPLWKHERNITKPDRKTPKFQTQKFLLSKTSKNLWVKNRKTATIDLVCSLKKNEFGSLPSSIKVARTFSEILGCFSMSKCKPGGHEAVRWVGAVRSYILNGFKWFVCLFKGKTWVFNVCFYGFSKGKLGLLVYLFF